MQQRSDEQVSNEQFSYQQPSGLSCDDYQVSVLPIGLIRPRDPAQSAADDPSLRELAASIRRDGLIQPITVRQDPEGGYTVIHGDRRLLASQMCGLETVEAVITPTGAPREPAPEALDALLSHQLDDLDEAEAIHRLCVEGGMSIEALAACLDCTANRLRAELQLMSLSEPVRALLRTHHLSSRIAYALLRLPSEEDRLSIARQAARQQLSIADVDLLISSALRHAQPGQRAAEGRTIAIMRDERLYLNAIRALVGQMQEAGLPAQLSERSVGVQTELTIRIPLQRNRRSARRHYDRAL